MQYLRRLIVISAGAIAVSLLAAAPAFAQDAKPDAPATDAATAEAPQDRPIEWSFDAQLRPRLELRTNDHFGLDPSQLNYVLPDTFASLSQRSRLGANIRADHLSAYLQLQHVAEWGVFGGDQLTDPVLLLHQGWLKYQPNDLVYVQAGRQQLAYGDHRVLGTVGWSQVGRAWDALRVGLTPSKDFGVDIFAGRYFAGAIQTDFALQDSLFEGDSWLTGAYFKLRNFVEPAFDQVDLYALYDTRVDDLSDDLPNKRGLLGLGGRLDGKWGIIDGNFEGMYELGSQCLPQSADPLVPCTDQTVDISAWFFDAVVGASVYQPWKLRLFAAYSYATGDDPETETNEAYFQFYPTAHKWLGLMDIIGPRTNIQDIRGGFSLKPGGVKIGETVHHFTRLQPESQTVGLEFDTTVFAPLTDNLDVGVGHGLFVPSDGVANSGDPDGVANWAFLQMNAVF